MKKSRKIFPVIKEIMDIGFLIFTGLLFTSLGVGCIMEAKETLLVSNNSQWVLAGMIFGISIIMDYLLFLEIKRKRLPDLLSQWRRYKNPELS